MQGSTSSDARAAPQDSDSNALSWDYANRIFNAHKADYATEIRSGVPVLPSELMDRLAPASSDHILHLMCNDGREAAYISYVSGARITGVDFSPAATEFAQRLNTDLRLSNCFVTEDVRDFLSESDLNNDRPTKVLLTLGSVRWIDDLLSFFSLACRTLGPMVS